MNERDIFVLADQALNRVVAQIVDHQWDMQMPASFARRGDAANVPTAANDHRLSRVR